ncbi:DUF917 domain-containing protein [Lipingzhangella sp. LS1_29]|uniref:DUF917 domain-containing protein n=1 Tax=Lipingzhangella rawalii TaxID=2055835 RepID=A0ABU2H4S7_9ACTN|nr:DUF917 domain-containing protein [Lipingzhangella rawalii]MDS1270301.1 DUF917 domain-containing protein [Lipingzhangella rawalii]
MTASPPSPSAPPPRDQITLDELDDLVIGAELFSSGGGGTDGPADSLLDWARQALARGPVRLLGPDRNPGQAPEAHADDPGNRAQHPDCVAVLLVGTPTMLEEHLPTGNETRAAVAALERWTGGSLRAIAPLNIAGVNCLPAVITAAQLDLPLLDIDGMGRGFPLVEQTTYALDGIDPTPLAVAGGNGEVVVVDQPAASLESMLRPLVLGCGGWVICACYPARVSRFLRAGIPGSINRAIQAGHALRHPGDTTSDGHALARRLGGRLLCRGRVVDVEYSPDRRSTTSHPASVSSLVIEEAERARRIVRLEAHNEILLALADGGVIGSVPDIICLVGQHFRRVIDIEQVTPGLDVDVILLPAAHHWHTAPGMALAGPAAFGLPELGNRPCA